ncbi:cytosolic phospholipase A2-like [Clavelina lepadiformis]|uniref:cytosolic phospholipase A2-like n=1 Tax=Clavelina lepadiformis TaxID=159417 RepID=UPI004041272F
MPDYCVDCDINESFQFVLRDDVRGNETVFIEVELYDNDVSYHDFLAQETIDVTNTAMDQNEHKTINFGLHGQLDVEIMKSVEDTPDFRYSLGLHPKEKEYRKKRLPHVYQALKTLLRGRNCTWNVAETPVVSVACSGGGFRALTGTSGAMEALKDSGLLDVITYLTGLSGSAW